VGIDFARQYTCTYVELTLAIAPRQLWDGLQVDLFGGIPTTLSLLVDAPVDDTKKAAVTVRIPLSRQGYLSSCSFSRVGRDEKRASGASRQNTPITEQKGVCDSEEGYRESRRCSRDTYPESNITKYTSIRREPQSAVNHKVS